MYDVGTEVSIIAVPGPNYGFTGFTGDLESTENPDTLVMDSDKDVLAEFLPFYTLDVDTNGFGGVMLDPAGGTYLKGTSVALTAVADSGSAFNNWSGDLTSSINPDTVEVDSNMAVTVNFLRSYALTATANGNGAVTLDPPGGVYPEGAVVTITATPDSGNIFSSWLGDLSGNTNPETITMDSDKNVIAGFTPRFNVSITQNGAGSVTLDPPGGIYDIGTSVTITATPDSGSIFGGWFGDLSGNTNPETFLVDADKEITVNFTRQYTLQATSTGNGSVTRSPDTALYDENSTVSLTAVPDSGYQFVSWSGDYSGTDNPAQITMDDDKVISASFEELPPNMYNLVAEINGAGSVVFNPAGGTYEEGTVVTVTAVPDSGSSFSGWSGDLTGTLIQQTITMDGNKNITASFISQYSLQIAVTGQGTVTSSPSGGVYDEGTNVTLTANPASGFQFDGWSGDLTGSNNPVTITMDGDKNITATFTEVVTITYCLLYTSPSPRDGLLSRMPSSA